MSRLPQMHTMNTDDLMFTQLPVPDYAVACDLLVRVRDYCYRYVAAVPVAEMKNYQWVMYHPLRSLNDLAPAGLTNPLLAMYRQEEDR